MPRNCSRRPSSTTRLRAGLTGGIGSGKSEAGKIFAGLGAFLVHADTIAREVLAIGTPGYEEVKQRWPRVITEAGPIDREALAVIVFSDDNERRALNAIVHPRVRERASALEAQAASDQIVVHEIPLLFEAGQGEFFDATILVTAPREQRIARVMGRSGLSRDEVLRRMAAQIAPEEAKKFATFLIENDGSMDELRQKAVTVYESLKTRPRSNTSQK